MQLGIDFLPVVWLGSEGVQLVRYVEVVQAGFQDERTRRRQNVLRRQSGIDQQFVHLPPRSVVADRNPGIEEDFVAAENLRPGAAILVVNVPGRIVTFRYA
jgi:hypothetical protein